MAEAIADTTWKAVIGWDLFAREAMGKQLIQAADSLGANAAEAFGRYHYGDKLTFLYGARGSLFETKCWLNRTAARGLVNDHEPTEPYDVPDHLFADAELAWLSEPSPLTDY